MLVYILDPLTLEKVDLIEEYESLLWTERFIDSGETKIVTGATHDNAVKLRPGAMLLHQDSNEPMLIETRDIKDGTITAAGKTIEAFFNERYIGPFGRTASAANIIRYAVANMQTRQSGRYAIPNLRAQAYVDDSGVLPNDEHMLAIQKGHDTVLALANKYSLGIAVIRQKNPATGNLELVFVVRDTNDRTQPDNYVRFSPKDDTFSGIDEMYSLADWVDVVLVHPPKHFYDEGTAFGWAPMSYPDHSAQGGPNNFALTLADNPFAWRIVEITSDDIDQAFIDKRITDYYWAFLSYPAHWADMSGTQKEEILRNEMLIKAKDEWHNRQSRQKVAFDGEVPGEILKFGRDYSLGDLVVAEGVFTGGKQTMMVSEYIRSSDGSGARSYPTLAQPLDTYDPSPTGGPGWGGSGT
jgi:hypothetical protein